MINFIKKYVNIWSVLAFIFSLLYGLLKIEKYKNYKKDEELEDTYRQIDLGQHNTDVKQFEAVQDTLLDVAKDKVKEQEDENYNDTLNPNTIIKL